MIRVTMMRLKRAWSLALALRNRGDARHPGRLQRLPMARAAQKSTFSRKDTECQKCKQIIDYLFSPLRTADEIRRIQSIIIEDIKRLQRSLLENPEDSYYQDIFGKEHLEHSVKCQRIIEAIFGEEKPVAKRIKVAEDAKEINDDENDAPSKPLIDIAACSMGKTNPGEPDTVIMPDTSIQDSAALLAKQLEHLKVDTPMTFTPEPDTILSTTEKPIDPVKLETNISNSSGLLMSTEKNADSLNIETPRAPAISSNMETYCEKAKDSSATLLATTAKQTEEQLAQKVEIIDETPLVEAENPKLTGFNTPPRVLGNTETDLYIAPEIEIDRETVIRDNVRHTFEKIVRRLENTELLAGINPLRCSVVNCVSGGSNHGGSKPPDKTDDASHSDNKNKSDQEKHNKYDKIAKRFLGTPNNKIDARLVKEMKRLGIPATGQKSSIEIQSSGKKPRKPNETILELEARKKEDNQSDNQESQRKSAIANFQSDSGQKTTQESKHDTATEENQLKEKRTVLNYQSKFQSETEHKSEQEPLLEDNQTKEKQHVVTFRRKTESNTLQHDHAEQGSKAKLLREKSLASDTKMDIDTKTDSNLLAQGIRYKEETTPDQSSKETRINTQLLTAKNTKSSEENTSETEHYKFDKYSFREIGDKAEQPFSVKGRKPMDQMLQRHTNNEANSWFARDKLPEESPADKVEDQSAMENDSKNDNMSEKSDKHAMKTHILMSPNAATQPQEGEKAKSIKNFSPWTTKHPYYQDKSELSSKSAEDAQSQEQNIIRSVPKSVKDASRRSLYDAHKPLDKTNTNNEGVPTNYTVLSKKHKQAAKQNAKYRGKTKEHSSLIDTPAIKHIATDPKGSGYTTEQSIDYVGAKHKRQKATTGETLQNLNKTLREIQRRSAHDPHRPILKLTVSEEAEDSKEPTPSTEQSAYYSVEDQTEKEPNHKKLFKQAQRMRDSQNWSSRQFVNYRKDRVLSNHALTNAEHQKSRSSGHKKKLKSSRRMPAYNPQMLFYPNYQEPPFIFPQVPRPSQFRPDLNEQKNQQYGWPNTFQNQPQQFVPYAPDPTNPEAFKQHAIAALYTEERKSVFDPKEPILNPYEKDYYKKNPGEMTGDSKKNAVENFKEQPAAEEEERPSYYPATPQQYFCPSAQMPHYHQYGNQFAGQWMNRNFWSKTQKPNQGQNFNPSIQQGFPHTPFQQNSLSFYVDENKPENQYTNVEVTETESNNNSKESTAKSENMEQSGYTYHIPNSWLDHYQPSSQEQRSFYQQQTPYSHMQPHLYNASQTQQWQNQYSQYQTPQNDQTNPQISHSQRPYQNPNYWERQAYFQGQHGGYNPEPCNYTQSARDGRYFNTQQSNYEEPQDITPQQYKPYNMQYGIENSNYQGGQNPQENAWPQPTTDPRKTVRARPLQQLQGALYAAGKDDDNETPQFQIPQQHGWMGQPYYQDTPMSHQMKYETSEQAEAMGSGRTMENMERRPPYDAHRPITSQNSPEPSADAEGNESAEENAYQPWMNQFPGAYPGVTPHGMFSPNAAPEFSQQLDQQQPYFQQDYTPFDNAGQLQQNEWVHPFSPQGQLQQYDETPSEQKQSEEDEDDTTPMPNETPNQNKPQGPNTPPPGPSAAFISLPQEQWKAATLSPRTPSAFDTAISPLPESVSLDECLPLSEMLRRIRRRSRLEYIAKWMQMENVEGKCGRERPPCPPPQPVCPKAEPTPPPPCPPPPPPCPRPCKPKCPPPCTPPPCCPPPCCKFESVSLGDTLYHIFTLLWDFGAARLIHKRSLSDTRCITNSPSETKSIMTDDEIPIEILGGNLLTTFGSDLGSYCWRVETLALARGFEPWVPVPSWPLPIKQEKKKLVCPKEGCRTPPPPRAGAKCERPCYPGNPCMGFPNTFRRS